MKIALITGITGQDGSYLAEFLLKKGYLVHGMIRRASINNTERIKHILNKITLHTGDITDSLSIIKILRKVKPNEIYNLAAQSYVHESFNTPEYSSNVDALGVLRLFESVRELGLKCKIYQASTSELYGKVEATPQDENTPFHPYSPYAVAKLYAYWMAKEYRQAYNMFICNGILFNHESERRGEEFVTRKITMAVARIAENLQDCLELGNINSLRDWGYAKDYVESMWLMLQQDNPDDYVIATGEQHSVREFVEKVFKENNIDIVWKGAGIKEKGYNSKTGKIVVRINKNFYRPTDVVTLLGNPIKAKKKLNWNPTKTSFDKLVHIMSLHDRNLVKQEKVNKVKGNIKWKKIL